MLAALKWSISPVTVIGWLSVYMQLQVTNRTPKSFNNPQQSSALAAAASPLPPPDSPNVASDSAAANKTKQGDAFVFPQFSGYEFSLASQLIDLCTLDLGLANFPYSVIAAAAMCHINGQ